MARQCDDFRFLLFHQPGHRPAHKKGTFGVDVHHSIVVVLAGLGDRNVLRNVDLATNWRLSTLSNNKGVGNVFTNPGGVDAVVNPAEFFCGQINHLLY